jgi:hypothetical protein
VQIQDLQGLDFFRPAPPKAAAWLARVDYLVERTGLFVQPVQLRNIPPSQLGTVWWETDRSRSAFRSRLGVEIIGSVCGPACSKMVCAARDSPRAQRIPFSHRGHGA